LEIPDATLDEFLMTAAPLPRRRHTEPARDDADRPQVPDIVPVPTAPSEQAVREPALVALPRPTPTNVPWPVSSLLGREAELGAIRDLVAVDRQRLVTLTGVGGSGKTRLAIQVAHELLDAFPDGVWFVELAPAADAALVSRGVANVLGVHEVLGTPLLDTLLGFLRRKRLLLVLDNCEHLIETCAGLAARLLATCPDLALLVTSREPLQIAGEQRWPVRPLDVPAPSGAATFEALGEIASVRLFVERARAIDPDFVLTDRNADAVAQICRRLDGIPLAIELAASHIGVLSAEQIAARLDGSFRLLTRSMRAGPTRQQTMEAALDWSYNLLAPAERAAFRALSTFAGGFDLEAAERVCGEHVAAGNATPLTDEVLDVLTGLVDKSLVVSERMTRGRRYRLLEPVRQYAALALVAEGESEGAQARHAAYYATLGERAAALLRGPEQVDWLDRLETERDNLRTTLTWIAEHGEAEAGLRLAVALTPYWEAHAYLSEGRRWLHHFLDAPSATGASDQVRMLALMRAGLLAIYQGDLARADELLSEALRQAEALGDLRTEAETRIGLAVAHRRQGDARRALTLTDEGLRLGQALADEWLVGLALLQGGIAHRDAGAADLAVTALDESTERLRRSGDVRWGGMAATMLGWALLEAGSPERAAQSLRDGAIALRRAGDQSFFLYALRGLAYASNEQGEHLRAARWYGASEALRVALGMEHPRRNRERDQVFLASVRAHLTASAYDGAVTDGAAMTVEQVGAEIVAAT
jgi:non-specific serine/threonine protein kinase